MNGIRTSTLKQWIWINPKNNSSPSHVNKLRTAIAVSVANSLAPVRELGIARQSWRMNIRIFKDVKSLNTKAIFLKRKVIYVILIYSLWVFVNYKANLSLLVRKHIKVNMHYIICACIKKLILLKCGRITRRKFYGKNMKLYV